MRAMSDPIKLANEPDFHLGGLQVSPGRRQIVAGAVAETLQPRVMQVFVALAGRRGDVVSRDELMARCWGGFAVSDDAIHRCIARLRRLAESHGGFSLETIPRVGYRLVESRPPARTHLHTLFAALAAGVLVLVATGLVYWL